MQYMGTCDKDPRDVHAVLRLVEFMKRHNVNIIPAIGLDEYMKRLALQPSK